jgi:hypothetical protein
MREDARWLAVYGAAFMSASEFCCSGPSGGPYTEDTIKEARRMAERFADIELSTRSEHPFPKDP